MCKARKLRKLARRAKIPDSFDAAVSHAWRRQPARAIRGGTRVLCRFLWERKRPGISVQGFEQALQKLPMPVLRSLAAAIRRRVQTLFGDRLRVDGFIPFGCDGTRRNLLAAKSWSVAWAPSAKRVQRP